MTTLWICGDFPPLSGGIARISHETAKNLNAIGNGIIVLAPHLEGDIEFDKTQDYDIIRVKGWKKPWISYFPLLLYLLKVVFKHDVKRIHALTWLPGGLVSLLLYKIFNIPYFVSIYAKEIMDLSPFLKKLMILTLTNAEKVFPISNYTKDRLISLGINPEKIVVVPGATDPVRFNPDVSPFRVVDEYNLHDKKVVLTVGRLVERKGFDMVIKALPTVLEAIPNVTYLIVGSGKEEQKLKDLVNRLKLVEHVVFVGHQDERLPEFYNACDVFIMPSREILNKDAEGFGIVYLEANACGKPVIGGKSGGTPDAVLDGKTGLLVDPLSIGEISDALIRLLSDDELAKELGRNGRRRILDELNWKMIAIKLQRVYECG